MRPFAADLDVGLVDAPDRRPGPAPLSAQAFLHFRSETLYPAINRRVVDGDSTFGHHRFEMAPASGTEKQAGIVHCSPRRGGLDDPRSPGNTAFGAVRQCGSGRSLGRDRQVNVVRGCAGLPGNSDLTPTAERRHRTGAPRRHLLIGNIGSGGRQRQAPGRGTGTIQSSSAPIRQSQFTRAVRRITALSQSRQHHRVGCGTYGHGRPCRCPARPLAAAAATRTVRRNRLRPVHAHERCAGYADGSSPSSGSGARRGSSCGAWRSERAQASCSAPGEHEGASDERARFTLGNRHHRHGQTAMLIRYGPGTFDNASDNVLKARRVRE